MENKDKISIRKKTQLGKGQGNILDNVRDVREITYIETTSQR
jgi:hypothetical protein